MSAPHVAIGGVRKPRLASTTSSRPGGGRLEGLAFRPLIDWSLENRDTNYEYFKLTLKLVDVKLDHRAFLHFENHLLMFLF